MRNKEAAKRIQEILTATFCLDNHWVISPTDVEVLEKAKMALGYREPKYVDCPKGWQGHSGTRFYCPSCGKAVVKYNSYCHVCGQAVKYPLQKLDKENNKIVLIYDDEL